MPNAYAVTLVYVFQYIPFKYTSWLQAPFSSVHNFISQKPFGQISKATNTFRMVEIMKNAVGIIQILCCFDRYMAQMMYGEMMQNWNSTATDQVMVISAISLLRKNNEVIALVLISFKIIIGKQITGNEGQILKNLFLRKWLMSILPLYFQHSFSKI